MLVGYAHDPVSYTHLDYIDNGNITNSVNFPAISMPRGAETRICIAHRNIPNTISAFTTLCGEAGINIENMLSKSRGDWAYTILDVSNDIITDKEGNSNLLISDAVP